jgi:hypothetical protein
MVSGKVVVTNPSGFHLRPDYFQKRQFVINHRLFLNIGKITLRMQKVF